MLYTLMVFNGEVGIISGILFYAIMQWFVWSGHVFELLVLTCMPYIKP